MNDTEIAIVAAGVLGAMIGYFGCALMASRRLLDIRKGDMGERGKVL